MRKQQRIRQIFFFSKKIKIKTDNIIIWSQSSKRNVALKKDSICPGAFLQFRLQAALAIGGHLLVDNEG